MILISGHPDADVRWTVAKHSALAGFAVAQQAHGVTIRQDQVGQVQHHLGTSRFCVDHLAQLAHALGVEAAANREHDGPASGALNLQQRHITRNATAVPIKATEVTGLDRCQTAEMSPMVKFSTM